MSNRFQTFLDQLNHAYERIHTVKEDAFWSAMMGLTDDADRAQKNLDRREIELNRFVQDPERLARVRAELAVAEAALEDKPTEEDLVELRGWARTLESNAIESAEARALAEEIIADEGRLALARGGMRLGYEDPSAGFVEASSVRLGGMLGSEKNEDLRHAAWDGLRSLEGFVLGHGFLEIVKKRNRLGKMLGAEDYYDWKVRRAEGLSKRQVFELLDELEDLTRDAGRRCIDDLRREHGQGRVTPWNLRYLSGGEVTHDEDPYFPFPRALERWGRSFTALGVDYAGAELVLDLLDRKGKHENGFMHGPVPAWRDNGSHRPARIQFTANAIPGMVGSGNRALQTLFHEGGHAAHFANIDMPAPCFSQEFAPTSVAFAETQSMFLDSLLDDADWRARYARDADGNPMPWELTERGIRARQPLRALSLRQMLSICYAEKALYEFSDDELVPARVLDLLRDSEGRMVFLDQGSPRPVLSVPHLISGDASAYYHGYVLAEMAVYQTRAFFLERDGHLVDNPKIGPTLRKAFWRPGNSKTFLDFVPALTGAPLTARHLADSVNRSADEGVAQARAALERLDGVPPFEGDVALGARLRVTHGNETVCDVEADGGFQPAAARFGAWVEAHIAQA